MHDAARGIHQHQAAGYSDCKSTIMHPNECIWRQIEGYRIKATIQPCTSIVDAAATTTTKRFPALWHLWRHHDAISQPAEIYVLIHVALHKTEDVSFLHGTYAPFSPNFKLSSPYHRN
jgi:hypothetical protein